ncbi:MAG: PepSY-like domain-containing protein [Rikenellaceae bacterium]
MKKLLFAAITLLFSVTTLSAEERVIEKKSLPKSAQTFISTYYGKDKVSIATVEKDLFETDYKVILTSGVKIEFDEKGNWTDIEGRRNSEIPKALVPEYIHNYVKSNFSSNKIIKIERDRKTTEVELDNGMELEFNSNGRLIKVDN